MKTEILNLLVSATAEAGVTLEGTPEQLADYVAERAAHLAAMAHEPGFAQAVTAERDNVMLRVAIVGAQAGDQADQVMRARLSGLMQGALALGAQAIVSGQAVTAPEPEPAGEANDGTDSEMAAAPDEIEEEAEDDDGARADDDSSEEQPTV